MSESNTLVLIDGMALVYRGHFAMIRNPRMTTTGLNTSSIFVFANVMLGVFAETQASHMAVVFDTRAPTFRHQLYPQYKATRDAMPEDIEKALPWLDRMLQALRVPVLRLDGWEADDVIGTLAKRGEEQGYQVIMVTPDKDYAQLVSPARTIWRPSKGGGGFDRLGPEAVCGEWGVERIEQVIDVLGLMGDTSDNVPGVPGIGPKTAKQLIADYGDLDGIYNHIDDIKGKRRENLLAHQEQAYLSRRLVTIDQDAPIECDLATLIKQESDEQQLSEVLEALEFRSLAERLLGADPQASNDAAYASITEVFHSYHLVQGAELEERFFSALDNVKRFCVDCETDGLEARHCGLLGLAFSWREHEGWYLPWPQDSAAQDALRRRLAPILADPQREKVGHHLKFDCAVLAAHGMPVVGPLWDTMLAAWLCMPEAKRSMDALAQQLLHYSPIPISALIGADKKQQISMAEVPLERVAEYAAEDADITWQLAQELADSLQEMGQERIFTTVECPLIEVLASMEAEGIAIDESALSQLGQALEQRITTIAKSINEVAGADVNINSPKQLGELLFDTLQLDPKAKRTAKSGQYQTNEQVLQRLAHRHEIAQWILDYREASKLKSTYVDQLPKAVDSQTGRIHTHFEQSVAATGRLASHDPNLQNIPIRSAMGRDIRRAFVPRDGDHLLLSLDYSQIELRIAAELSQDQALREAFTSGVDFHTATAAAVYGMDPNMVDSELRRRAKTVNFGILYGVSAFGLSERLGIPRGEAKKLIDAYFDRFHGLRAWMDGTVEQAREQGYVTTLYGRRRELRDIGSRNAAARAAAERLAINSPVQGTAAEVIKVAMINVHRHLREQHCRSRMLLQVHDELVFDLHRSEREELPPILAGIMRDAVQMSVPLEVEYAVADNWLDAH
ncbi:MAG: DNA polymerase I [Planctomycetota bacterium]|nr:MAG: DNA polymerase I [Planctomycetota bacterium]